MEASPAADAASKTPEEHGRSPGTTATITAGVGAAHALLFLLAW